MSWRFNRLEEFALVLFAACAAFAQGSRVNGPVLGFVYDAQARGLRPVTGTPGAAYFGPPLDLGFAISQAAAASNYALAVSAGDSSLVQVRTTSPPSVRKLDSFAPAPERIVLSPGGNRAALYHAAAGTIQLAGNLTGEPSLDAEIGTAGLSGLLTALAVSDSGDLLAAFLDGDSGAVYLLTGGPPRLILNVQRASAISFLNGSSDALIADPGWNQVTLVRDVAGAANAVPVAGAGEGITAPVGAGVSIDNQRAFIANAGARTVIAVDLGTGAAQSIDCGATPTTLRRLGAQSVFLLGDLADDPVWLLDADGAEPRTVFIPARQLPANPQPAGQAAAQ